MAKIARLIADFEKHFCSVRRTLRKGGLLHGGQRDITLGNHSIGASREELCPDNHNMKGYNSVLGSTFNRVCL